jgi:hypothetical protein
MKIFNKLLSIGFLSTLVSLSACGHVPKQVTKVTDTSAHAYYPTDHQLTSLERREWSHKFLQKKGVPILATLPLIEDGAHAKFRAQDAVARKAVVLYGLIHVANGKKTSDDVIAYFKKYNLWNDVSSEERAYLTKKNRTDEDNNPVTWRIENLNVLLWALGHFERLPFPTTMCDFKDYKDLPNLSADPSAWIGKAKLRNKEDILNETDLIYRIHWATTEASLKNKPLPAGLNNDIVMERHFALNWLTMYAEEWDDITTDT